MLTQLHQVTYWFLYGFLLSLIGLASTGCGGHSSKESQHQLPTIALTNNKIKTNKTELVFRLQTPSRSPSRSKDITFIIDKLPNKDVSVSIYLGLQTSYKCNNSRLIPLGTPVSAKASKNNVVLGEFKNQLKALEDGTYKFFAKIRGTNLFQCLELTYTLDTTKPLIMVQTSHGNQPMEDDNIPKQSRTWTWNCQDVTNCQYRYKIATAALMGGICPPHTFSSSDSYSQVATVTQDSRSDINGKYCIHIQAQDESGNESFVSSAYGIFDNKGPLASSVELSGGPTYIGGDSIDLMVTFDEKVVVQGQPRIPLVLNNGEHQYADYYKGSNSKKLTFRYTMTSTDDDVDGIEGMDLIDLNSGDITDEAGNTLTSLTLPSTNLSSIRIQGDSANLVFSKTHLSVDENGGTATYRVWLNKAPTSPVTVNLEVKHETLVRVSTNTLTFETDNNNGLLWSQPQVVTVTGIDDDIDNDITSSGEQGLRLTHLEHTLSSLDNKYKSLNPKFVEVRSQDDDTIGNIRLTLDPNTINEHDPSVPGGPSNHTAFILITAEFEGSSSPNVYLAEDLVLTVSVSPGTAQDEDFIAIPNFQMTLLSGQSYATKNLSLTLVDDEEDEGLETLDITGEIVGLIEKSVLPATLILQDNDEKGVLVSRSSLSVEENNGATTYSVQLTSQPTGVTQVHLVSEDTSAATVSPPLLTFEPHDDNGQLWSAPQTVTVKGVMDSNSIQNRQTTLSHYAVGGGYTDLLLPSVNVSITNTSVLVTGPIKITEAEDIFSHNHQNYSIRGTCSQAGSVSLQVGPLSAMNTNCNNGSWSLSGINTSTNIMANGPVTLVATQGSQRAEVDVDRCISSGDGTEDSPQLICTYAELKNIQNNLYRYYALERDIDASSSWSEGSAGCKPYDGTNITDTNACSGWTPLAPSDETSFKGQLDGQGYRISNLYINSGASALGLFGYLEGEVFNLHLRNVRIHSTTEDQFAIGSLAGYTYDAVINGCSATGRIFGKHREVGGLIGSLHGKLLNSYTDVTIEVDARTEPTGGSLRLVGGLAGGSSRETLVMSSHSKGSLTLIVHDDAQWVVLVGGLIGGVDGVIHSSYSLVHQISGKASSKLGGLIGGPNYFTPRIYQSYFAGAIGGESLADPIGESIDHKDQIRGQYSSVFWDIDISGHGTSKITEAEGLSIADMQDDCANGKITGICSLGTGFHFASGGDQYPRVKKCTTCVIPNRSQEENPVFSDELVGGQ